MQRTGGATLAVVLAGLAASPAPAQDVEMSCIGALSAKLGVSAADVEIRNQKGDVGRGTRVHATVNLVPYTCFVDDDGRVTSIERGSV